MLPILTTNTLHLWYATLDEFNPDSVKSVLSPDEQSKALRFIFDSDRDRYIVGRGILRLLLSAYNKMKPEDIHFQYGSHGKPSLSGPIRFNVSHSEAMILYAVAHEREVGVDVEFIRPLAEQDALVEEYLTVNEQFQLRALPYRQQLEGFLTCWTQKEAYLKACGIGLVDALNRVDLTQISAGESPWWIHNLTPTLSCPGYVCALAIEGSQPDLVITPIQPATLGNI
jgi:4'-phosphopantetheinyl transferase